METGGEGGSKLLDDDASKFQGQQQIATSLVHLDKKKASGIDDTTVIRVNADLRESRRRVAEEAAREERMAAIEAEAEASMAENAAIEAKWAALHGFKVPQDLHAAIEEQKKRCAAVLASKDELIAELHLALKVKDEEYVKTLKIQVNAHLACSRNALTSSALGRGHRGALAADASRVSRSGRGV